MKGYVNGKFEVRGCTFMAQEIMVCFIEMSVWFPIEFLLRNKNNEETVSMQVYRTSSYYLFIYIFIKM